MVKQKFRSLKDAQSFVRSKGIKTKPEYLKWAKSGERPSDIPASPASTYKDEWVSWPNFLGNGNIANKHRKFRSFDDARSFMRSSDVKSSSKYREWAKSDARPDDIPWNPPKIYEEEWISWADFLGTDNKAPKNHQFRSLKDTQSFIRSKGIKKQKEYREWAKTSERPYDIPSSPERTYKDEWISWADFLGSKNISSQKRTFRSFEEAKSYIQSQKILTKTEFMKWAMTSARPDDIPSNPPGTYKEEWGGWPDFLGNGNIANQRREFRSFDDARSFMRSSDVMTSSKYREWAMTSARPDDIPYHPRRAYKDVWTSWADFLGSSIRSSHNRIFRSYKEARSYVHSQQITSKTEYMEWAKTNARPDDIPSTPARTYNDEWISWEDWLGFKNRWDIKSIRVFVKSLLPYVDKLTPAEMYVLLQQSGLLDITSNSKASSFVQALKSGKFPKEELEKFAEDKPSLVDEFISSDISSLKEDEDFNLPIIQADDALNALTALDSILHSNMDEETVDYFIKSAVAKIWKHAFLDEKSALQQLEQYKDNNAYSREVKELFLKDYRGSKDLAIPDGYNSDQHKPTLMQRYTAYLVKERKRLGNWSGTGAGKTLSAILASRVIDAKLTVICCPNSLTDEDEEGWKKEILKTYPNSHVVCKSTSLEKLNSQLPQYLILNYEFFQRPNAASELEALLDRQKVDFVIIDEIHYSKQRVAEQMSKRKETLENFLVSCSLKNEDLHVLGMSATPVINNLFEGKTLIELITGIRHDEICIQPTVPNCIALYKHLVTYGIRETLNYSQELNIQQEQIDCSKFIPEIARQGISGTILDLEIILTKAKIPFIIKKLQPKTIVFTQYIHEIVELLQNAIKQAGWRVGLYTGENKDGKASFINGDTDILIASSCAGTGIDGLQKVCNRLIINSLPWTHANFEQLVGRIYRRGQQQDSVDVFIPITFAEINDEKWSWCESRWKRIEYKKSIADAAVDGIVPEGHLRTPEQAYKDTMSWLKRLESGELCEVVRRKISIND